MLSLFNRHRGKALFVVFLLVALFGFFHTILLPHAPSPKDNGKLTQLPERERERVRKLLPKDLY